MKSITKIITFIGILQFTLNLYGQNLTDSTAIQNIVEEEVASWNNGDAQQFSTHFADDGTFTNIFGAFFIGHKEFLSRHEQILKGIFKGSVLTQNVVSLKFPNPDVAVVETITWVSNLPKDTPIKGLDDKGRLRSRLLQVIVRKENTWKITAYHNVDIKQGIPVPEPR